MTLHSVSLDPRPRQPFALVAQSGVKILIYVEK